MHQNNQDLIVLSLIDLAKEANRLRNRSSIDALRRSIAVEREQMRRFAALQQEDKYATAQETR